MGYSIINLLKSFKSFDLKSLEAANLLERKDFKYCFSINILEEILNEMLAFYEILQINEERCFTYETEYYDTENFDFFIDHHNGKGNRVKARMRHYVQSEMTFVEQKNKNNKAVTTKFRDRIEDKNADLKETWEEKLNLILDKKCSVIYDRITFLNIEKNEKITLDFNLQFKNENEIKSFKNICIAEIKCKALQNSTFKYFMSKRHIHAFGLSKYCMAITQLYPQIKHNNFKPILYKILKTNSI